MYHGNMYVRYKSPECLNQEIKFVEGVSTNSSVFLKESFKQVRLFVYIMYRIKVSVFLSVKQESTGGGFLCENDIKEGLIFQRERIRISLKDYKLLNWFQKRH